MAGSVNKVILVGNLGADPEIRRTQDGRPIVNLRVATTDTWRDKGSGERKERTEWHRVVIFSEGLAKVAEQYLRRGRGFISKGSSRPANGRTRAARIAIPPRSSCRTSVPRWCCSTAPVAAAAPATPTTNGQPISARAPELRGGRSAPARQPAMAGAGRRDDMDDEIPF